VPNFSGILRRFQRDLAGAALYYESLSIFIYTGLFFLTTHLFVVLYEEPTLRRTFGDEYEAYLQRVRRWRPRASKK
jgi:protein-S-isoprenylcysteine O-methyltransferase Ste14